MTEDHTATTWDVFAAARWFHSLWNSRGRAVSPTEVEWECRTWGSGCGRGGWEHVALFSVVAELFTLKTYRNREERDEWILLVPIDDFDRVRNVIERLGIEPEDWPWFDLDEDYDRDRQIVVAAETLGITPSDLEANADLLEVLHID